MVMDGHLEKNGKNEKERNSIETGSNGTDENYKVNKKKKAKKRKQKNDILDCAPQEVDAEGNSEECADKKLKRKKSRKKNDENDLLDENGMIEGKIEPSDQCQTDDEVKQLSKKRKKSKKKDLNESSTEENEECADEDSADPNPDEGSEKKKKDKPSKRQLKREKAELRAVEAREVSKLAAAQKALNYVSKWKHAKSDWKFEKVKQIWLIDNLMDKKYVPDDHFPLVLEYFEGCQGMARKNLIKKADSIIKKIEDDVKDDEEFVETTEYRRARQLLQALPTEE